MEGAAHLTLKEREGALQAIADSLKVLNDFQFDEKTAVLQLWPCTREQ